MHIEKLFTGDGLRRMREVLTNHARLLNDVTPLIKGVVANNEEIFRRPLEGRMKAVRSIHRKIDENGMDEERFFGAASDLPDIAGVRLTIATKDQHAQAEGILSVALAPLGRLEKDEPDGGLTIRSSGYSANHLILKSSTHPGTACEIQVRTLTQDLWAVFSHYETYKRPSSRSVTDEEFVNYARLMDVADDYARTIRLRKIADADSKHRHVCLATGIVEEGPGGILTHARLSEIVNAECRTCFPLELKAEAVSAMRICDLMEELPAHSIYTARQLLGVLNSTEYIKVIVERMAVVGVRSRAVADVLFLLCTCYRMSQAEVTANEVGTRMLGLIDAHLAALRLEEYAESAISFVDVTPGSVPS